MQHQTLAQFMRSPFGTPTREKEAEYSRKYHEYKVNRKIDLVGYTTIEDSYYYHIKIPSESKEGRIQYDVVVRFFSDNEEIKKEKTLVNYYVQFFSNSPSFIYKYAVLYKNEGFLIDTMYDKLDPKYKDTLPEKTNPNMQLSYDRSIYFACRYLSEMRFRALTKYGIILNHKISKQKFFQNISSFESSQIASDLDTFEKRTEKEAKKILADYEEKIKERRKNVKTSTKSTTAIKKINKIAKKAKIKAKKSTYKN